MELNGEWGQAEIQECSGIDGGVEFERAAALEHWWGLSVFQGSGGQCIESELLLATALKNFQDEGSDVGILAIPPNKSI